MAMPMPLPPPAPHGFVREAWAWLQRHRGIANAVLRRLVLFAVLVCPGIILGASAIHKNAAGVVAFAGALIILLGYNPVVHVLTASPLGRQLGSTPRRVSGIVFGLAAWDLVLGVYAVFSEGRTSFDAMLKVTLISGAIIMGAASMWYLGISFEKAFGNFKMVAWWILGFSLVFSVYSCTQRTVQGVQTGGQTASAGSATSTTGQTGGSPMTFVGDPTALPVCAGQPDSWDFRSPLSKRFVLRDDCTTGWIQLSTREPMDWLVEPDPGSGDCTILVFWSGEDFLLCDGVPTWFGDTGNDIGRSRFRLVSAEDHDVKTWVTTQAST